MPIAFFRKLSRFATDEGGSIKARVLRSGIWVGLSQVGITLLGTVRSVVLARLLTPEVFGLMGLASVVVRTIETFTRPGIAQALIARQQSFEDARDTAFTMLVLRGILLAALLCIASPWVARFYAEPSLMPMLMVLSLTFVIGSFRNINTIARERELEFRKLTYLSQTTAFVGVVVTISLAWWLRSVWSLVIGAVVTVTLDAVLSYVYVPGRPRFAFDREIARGLFAYGKFVTGSAAVTFIALEFDAAVIGKMLGTKQLGYYTLASTIAMLASVTLSKLVSGIMMPAYSKLQTDLPALRNVYLRALSMLSFAIVPATVGLVVVADPLVRVVVGPQWAPTIWPLQVLALFGLFRALMAFSGYLFEGIGQPRIAFYLAVMRLAIIVPLIFPAMRAWGLVGAASTVAVSALAQWLVGLIYLRKHIGLTPTAVLGAIARPILTALPMAAAVYGVGTLVNGATVPGLVTMVLAGVAVFAALNARPLLALRRERLG